MRKLTPIIVVDSLEDALPFWTDRLAFEVTVTVPHEDRLGFAILERGDVQIMYQSRDSVAADLPPLADEVAGQTAVLFVEVGGLDELDAVGDALEGADVIVLRRSTFYGMDEIFVRAPCGTVVGFAARSSS